MRDFLAVLLIDALQVCIDIPLVARRILAEVRVHLFDQCRCGHNDDAALAMKLQQKPGNQIHNQRFSRCSGRSNQTTIGTNTPRKGKQLMIMWWER